MKGFKMYKQIQQLKEIGFTRSRAGDLACTVVKNNLKYTPGPFNIAKRE